MDRLLRIDLLRIWCVDVSTILNPLSRGLSAAVPIVLVGVAMLLPLPTHPPVAAFSIEWLGPETSAVEWNR